MKLKINRKEIKERAKKIANWVEIECEINDYTRLNKYPKEYELKTIKDLKTIQEVQKILNPPFPSIINYKKIYEMYLNENKLNENKPNNRNQDR